MQANKNILLGEQSSITPATVLGEPMKPYKYFSHNFNCCLFFLCSSNYKKKICCG